MEIEGLFRISGSISLVNEIKDKFDLGMPIEITDYEPHAVTGALKLYLRELPEVGFFFNLKFNNIAVIYRGFVRSIYDCIK
jgi:hypothetical protein